MKEMSFSHMTATHLTCEKVPLVAPFGVRSPRALGEDPTIQDLYYLMISQIQSKPMKF